MPRRHVLHLGLHKTATTALQEFLAGQNKALMAAGVRYLPLGRMRSDVTPLMTSLGTPQREQLRNLLEDIRKPAVLLSDENILGAPGDLMQGALYPYGRNRVETFCRERPEAGITLILVLREPHAFLVSMYCEYLRHNAFVSFGDYLSGFEVEDFSYARVFAWLTRLPKNVRVRLLPFEPARGGGVQTIARTVVEAACGTEHAVDYDAFPSARSRASYSAEELDFAGRLAAASDPQAARFFLNMLDGRGKRFGETRFAPLDPALAERLAARYDADLARFAEQGLLAVPAPAA